MLERRSGQAIDCIGRRACLPKQLRACVGCGLRGVPWTVDSAGPCQGRQLAIHGRGVMVDTSSSPTLELAFQGQHDARPGGSSVSKRALLVGAALTTSALSTAASEAENISPRQAQWAERVAAAMEAGPVPTDVGDLVLVGGPDGSGSGGVGFFQAGPFKTARVERQRHTCSSCFPNCVGDECLLRVNVTYPRNFLEGDARHRPPFPLAIFSSGFLVESRQYQSYADRLASWGYVVLTYDKVENVTSNRNDVVTACFIKDLIDWAASSAALGPITDTSRVLLCGHSRGGKVSVLAGAQDPRVVSLCLVDPVDNTVYAPLAPGYPSAVRTLADSSGYAQPHVVRAGMPYEPGKAHDDDALWLNDVVGSSHGETEIAGFLQDKYMRNVPVAETADDLRMAWSGASVPIAVVGAGKGADCAPVEANYTHFYDAAPAPKWLLEVEDAGHFQFVDAPTTIQRSVCTEGRASSNDVKGVTYGAMVAWAELTVRRVCVTRPADDTSSGKRAGGGSKNRKTTEALSAEEVKRIENVLRVTAAAAVDQFGARSRINSRAEL